MADDTTTDPGAQDGAATAPPPQPDNTNQSGQDTLGDGGKKALDTERAARREAEKQLKVLQGRLKEFEDRDKTEAERTAERLSSLEAEAKRATAEAARFRVIAETGLPSELHEFLSGDTEDELRARAEKLKGHLAPQPRFQGTADQGVRGGATERTIDDDIADAEKAGNIALAIALKARKLAAVQSTN